LQGVSRKPSESFEGMMRRFNRKIQQAGILTSYKKNRYFEKEPSKKEQRMTAIRKESRKKAKNKSLLLKGF
jgi:small subunit ribosomal protein S21